MLKVREPIFRTGNVARLARVRDTVVKADKLFLLTVVLPTLLAVLYFGFFASNVYVSESQFVVRSPDKTSTTALGMILKSTGFSNSGDEVYAAQDYVQSRDALKALNQNDAVRRSYHNAGVSIFDRFDPLGLSGSFEDLYRYYKDKVAVQYDTSSSIATLRVSAYNPADAYRFNRQLLGL